MKRLLLWMILGLGLGIIGWQVEHPRVLAQEDDEDIREALDYVGGEDCIGCHSAVASRYENTLHPYALIPADEEAFLVADFSQGADLRTMRLPFDDEARPFTLNDAAYILGAGRYHQAFLFELDDDEYVVFPALWNTQAQAWEALGEGGESWWTDPRYNFAASCVGCHVTGLEALDESSADWEDDGVQCEACHGPGSAHIEQALATPRNASDEAIQAVRDLIVLSPSADQCGQCHSQGVAVQSGHPFPLDYRPDAPLLQGDNFQLVAADDPAHWWESGHGSNKYMQYNEWLQYSDHPQALQAVLEYDAASEDCLACHSGDYRQQQRLMAFHEANAGEGAAPEALSLETAALGIGCISCHDPHGPGTASSDSPPLDSAAALIAHNNFNLRQDSYALCTDCHSDPNLDDRLHYPVQQMFEGWELVAEVAAVPSAHFTSAEGPDCSTCHMPRVPVQGGSTRASHSFDIVPPGAQASELIPMDSCSTCHESSPAAMQVLINEVQASTSSRLEIAQAAAADAPDWVTKAISFVAQDQSRGVHNYAYTKRLLDAVEQELGLVQAPESSDMVDILPITEDEAAELLETVTPPAAPVVEADPAEPLNPTSLGIMLASVLLILFAAWAFFFRLRT